MNARCAVLLWLAVCCIAGCSMPGPRQESAKRTYLLQGTETSRAPERVDTLPCLSLRVSMPASAPGYGSTGMAYTNQAPRLAYFAYHEWVDTPARMMAAMLEGYLEASGLFRAVLTGSTDIRTDLRLDSEIISLRQDFNAEGSSLSLSVKISLIDVRRRALLGGDIFRYREPASSADPEAGAVAANRAADRFLSDLMSFMADSIGRIDCPSSPAGGSQGSIGPSGE